MQTQRLFIAQARIIQACMRRIVIMGPPGSGKSTLSRKLGDKLGLPIFHLDQIYWRPGWVAAPQDEFAAEVARISVLPEWIIEGNYTGTLAPRLARADTVVFLDCPSILSVFRVITRAIRYRGMVREDMPAGCPEQVKLDFFSFTLNWNRRSRQRNLKMLAEFGGTVHVLRGDEVAGFVRSIR